MSVFNVYCCGQKVLIGEKIPGTVTAICVRGEVVTYEIKWFDGNNIHSQWLESFMIKPDGNAVKMRIGFNSGVTE